MLVGWELWDLVVVVGPRKGTQAVMGYWAGFVGVDLFGFALNRSGPSGRSLQLSDDYGRGWRGVGPVSNRILEVLIPPTRVNAGRNQDNPTLIRYGRAIW
jgi:hypothetical protein